MQIDSILKAIQLSILIWKRYLQLNRLRIYFFFDFFIIHERPSFRKRNTRCRPLPLFVKILIGVIIGLVVVAAIVTPAVYFSVLGKTF